MLLPHGLPWSDLGTGSGGIEAVSVAIRDGHRVAVIGPFGMAGAEQSPQAEESDGVCFPRVPPRPLHVLQDRDASSPLPLTGGMMEPA